MLEECVGYAKSISRICPLVRPHRIAIAKRLIVSSGPWRRTRSISVFDGIRQLPILAEASAEKILDLFRQSERVERLRDDSTDAERRQPFEL